MQDIKPPKRKPTSVGKTATRSAKLDRPSPKPPKELENAEPEEVINEADLEQQSAKSRKILIAPHKHFIRFRRWWLSLSRNMRFGIIAVVLLLFGAGAVLWFAFVQPSSNPSLQITKHAKPKPKAPTTVASPLTGLQVAPDLIKRPVTGIMIENSLDARPQSGIQDAGIVFEAIAEGGITRFLTLYQDSSPQYIGPVRSLRPYYIDWGTPFDAGIAHVGGSPEALSRIRSSGKDLDQFFNSDSFWRSDSRPAPHNVYTSFAKLDALNQSKGFTSSKYTSLLRKADKALKVPVAKSIDISISSFYFNSHYDYDAASNSYLRSEGGKAHTVTASESDFTGVQLKPKLVIAMVMSYGIDADGQHSDYTTSGSGTAYIFQDGGIAQGTWNKADISSQLSFTDTNGVPIKLDAGQTWIAAVDGDNKVTYTP